MEKYGAFIRDLHDQLMDMVREAENMGFHHDEPESKFYAHYARLVELASHARERREWYDYATKDR